MNERDGQLEEVDGRWRLRFTRTLPHPREKVWQAITEPAHLAAWFPTRIEGERAPGAALRFVFEHGEGPDLEGDMLVYEPPSVMEFSWGGDLLRLELEAAGASTVLTLLDTLEELGKAARDGAGWHHCLDALGHHLDGTQPPPDEEPVWKRVQGSYVERFGPEASTLGPPESVTG